MSSRQIAGGHKVRFVPLVPSVFPASSTSFLPLLLFSLPLISPQLTRHLPIPQANLNNPNTSDESKQHSRQVLDEFESSGELQRDEGAGKNEGNIIGGHKANLKSAFSISLPAFSPFTMSLIPFFGCVLIQFRTCRP